MIDKLIIGAIAGDMTGSVHAGKKQDPAGFPLFTDNTDYTCDSVLTVAVMDSLLNGRDYAQTLQVYGRKYPGRGYGTIFTRWLSQDCPRPYNSWNNGAAIRVSPVGYSGRTLKEVLDEARRCAEVSHNHPDGIQGAQATAAAVFLAKNGRSKDEIRDYIEKTFRYNLQRSIEEIRPGYYYDQSCRGTVPEAIIAFLDSDDFESALRLAISLGGNSGSISGITGGIAQAFYKKLPEHISKPVISHLTPEMFEIIEEFSTTYPLSLFH